MTSVLSKPWSVKYVCPVPGAEPAACVPHTVPVTRLTLKSSSASRVCFWARILVFQKSLVVEARSRFPSVFASTMEAAWGFCLFPFGGLWHPSVDLLAQLWTSSNFVMSSLPTLHTHSQVALEVQEFPHLHSLEGTLASNFGQVFPLHVLEYCKFCTVFLSTELSSVFILDSLPKASTVLRTSSFPDFRVGPGALPQSRGVG